MKTCLSAILVLLLGVLSTEAQDGRRDFSLTIGADATVKAGEPIGLSIKTTNTSNHEISTARIQNPIGGHFEYDVRDDKGTPVAETESLRQLKAKQSLSFEGRRSFSVYLGKLKPGDTEQELVWVNQFYDMSRPGKYSIQVTKGPVSSNTIIVIVTP